MPKKIGVIFLTLMLIVSGCDFKDIDKRLFVVAMGFDKSEKDENKLKISLKIAIPQGDPKQGNQEFEIVTVESETIAEGLRRAKSVVDKELDYGHTKIIIIGEEVAKKDIRHITDWGIRRRDLQLIALAAVGQPTALEVLKVKPKTERVPANALFLTLTKDGTESPFINTQYLFDFHRRLTEIGLDPFLPVIQTKDEKYEISTVALLNKEKIISTLNPDESRLFNILEGSESVKTNFTVHSDNNTYDLNIDNTSANYKITTVSGRPTIKYDVKFQGSLEEKTSEAVITPDKLKKIESEGEKELSKKVEALLSKIQKTGTDPLGFGLRYSARSWNNETEMEQFKDMYKDIKFEVSSKINLKYSGVIE